MHDMRIIDFSIFPVSFSFPVSFPFPFSFSVHPSLLSLVHFSHFNTSLAFPITATSPSPSPPPPPSPSPPHQHAPSSSPCSPTLTPRVVLHQTPHRLPSHLTTHHTAITRPQSPYRNAAHRLTSSRPRLRLCLSLSSLRPSRPHRPRPLLVSSRLCCVLPLHFSPSHRPARPRPRPPLAHLRPPGPILSLQALHQPHLTAHQGPLPRADGRFFQSGIEPVFFILFSLFTFDLVTRRFGDNRLIFRFILF